MEVMGWSHGGMTSRYQHMTTELMTSIADQIGGLFWADQAEDEDGDNGSAAQPVAV
jgi:integrase